MLKFSENLGDGRFFRKEEAIEIVVQRVRNCKACPLHETRINPVPGEGSLDTPIIFVGEGPGEEEDRTGRPFVGKAGQMLNKLLKEVGLSRDKVYITNVVKCRPPGNRVPTNQEMAACSHFLMAQIQIINPKVIVALGSTALSFFLEKKVSITRMRGKLIDWLGGKVIFPTFHPSYLLRNRSTGPGSPYELALQDMKKVKELYDEYRKV